METALIKAKGREEKKNLHFSKNPLINKSLHDLLFEAGRSLFQLHNFSMFCCLDVFLAIIIPAEAAIPQRSRRFFLAM
jgi:hypothetical protein